MISGYSSYEYLYGVLLCTPLQLYFVVGTTRRYNSYEYLRPTGHRLPTWGLLINCTPLKRVLYVKAHPPEARGQSRKMPRLLLTAWQYCPCQRCQVPTAACLLRQVYIYSKASGNWHTAVRFSLQASAFKFQRKDIILHPSSRRGGGGGFG